MKIEGRRRIHRHIWPCYLRDGLDVVVRSRTAGLPANVLGIWYLSWRGLGDCPYGGCDMEAVSTAVLLHSPIEDLRHKGRQVEVRSRCR